jgi:hypothetical protein
MGVVIYHLRQIFVILGSSIHEGQDRRGSTTHRVYEEALERLRIRKVDNIKMAFHEIAQGGVVWIC